MGSGTLYNLLARGFFLLSGYALQFSMAHWLGAATEYGRFGVVLSLITLARVLLSTGLPQAVTRYVATQPESAYEVYRRGVRIQLAGAFSLAALYALASPLLAKLLNDTTLLGPILLSSPLIVFMAWYQVNLGYLNGRRWFGRSALLTVLYSILRYGCVAVLVAWSLGIEGAMVGLVCATGVVAAASRIGIRRGGKAAEVSIGAFLNFSWPLVALSVGVSALLNLDLLILERYFPSSEIVGFYNGAINVGKAPYFVFYAFATTTLPSLAHKRAQGDPAAARAMLSRHVQGLLTVVTPCAAFMAIAAPDLLRLLFQPEYVAAAGALTVLSVGVGCLSLMVVLCSALAAADRPRLAMLVVLVCLPVQLVLGFLWIPTGGMMAAAISNTAAAATGFMMAATLVLRVWGKLISLRKLLGIMLSTGLSTALLCYLQAPSDGVWIIPKLLVAGATYLPALIAFGGLSREELRALVRQFGHTNRAST